MTRKYGDFIPICNYEVEHTCVSLRYVRDNVLRLIKRPNRFAHTLKIIDYQLKPCGYKPTTHDTWN
jgi:hypothetical protein